MTAIITTTIDIINSYRLWKNIQLELIEEARNEWGNEWSANLEFTQSITSRNLEWCEYELNYYGHQFQRSLHLN